MEFIDTSQLLGDLLVKYNYVSFKDFQRCLQIQGNMENPPPIGQILIDQKLITKRALEHVLLLQKKYIQKKEEQILGISIAQLKERLNSEDLRDYLKVAVDVKASDFYLLSGKSPAVRVNGYLLDLPCEAIAPEKVRQMLFGILSEREVRMLEKQRHSMSFCFSLPGIARFRASLFQHHRGFDAIFRIIPFQIPSLEELGFPKSVYNLLNHTMGMILITGPASSGKTTTLAAMINELNHRRKGHIISIEDPIEFVFESKNCLITQREIGRHAESYLSAFRAALREDANIIVVGELRDPETFSVALTASETGHLVLGTLHTTNSESTIHRILDNFPPRMADQVRGMLSSALRGIISQKLIPNKEGTGRELAIELMISNSAIAHLIRENKPHQIPMILQTHRSRGMCWMDDSIVELYKKGCISKKEALYHLEDKDKLLSKKPLRSTQKRGYPK
ncbi:MAG: PilT/PilU family type 4a pilus ATPase [Planctomycetota bacterium]|nr:MAG: PilT/PilU family type 4a pilus ATPase [Planctomycetota bacterium]